MTTTTFDPNDIATQPEHPDRGFCPICEEQVDPTVCSEDGQYHQECEPAPAGSTLEQVRSAAISLGLILVTTADGMTPIAAWTPYGNPDWRGLLRWAGKRWEAVDAVPEGEVRGG
jgi:hypothetical protein